MKVKYDPQVDAGYISFKKGRRGATQVTTVRITEDIAVDFGPNEKIAGIEILDASRNLGWVTKEPKVEIEKIGSK